MNPTREELADRPYAIKHKSGLIVIESAKFNAQSLLSLIFFEDDGSAFLYRSCGVEIKVPVSPKKYARYSNLFKWLNVAAFPVCQLGLQMHKTLEHAKECFLSETR